jgi:hypothetical protein
MNSVTLLIRTTMKNSMTYTGVTTWNTPCSMKDVSP